MRSFCKVLGLSLGIALTLALALPAGAADAPKPKAGRLSGDIHNLNKDKTEVTLRKGTADRIVLVSAKTSFFKEADTSTKTEASSMDEVKEGNYMTCRGTWDGLKLAATSCTIAGQHGKTSPNK